MADYLAVFTMDKAGPRFRAWKAMGEADQAARAEVGVAAVKAWEAAHRDHIVHIGGPLGSTLRIDDAGRIADAVNPLTVFVVVRADTPRCRGWGRRPPVPRPPPHDDLPLRWGGGDAGVGGVGR